MTKRWFANRLDYGCKMMHAHNVMSGRQKKNNRQLRCSWARTHGPKKRINKKPMRTPKLAQIHTIRHTTFVCNTWAYLVVKCSSMAVGANLFPYFLCFFLFLSLVLAAECCYLSGVLPSSRYCRFKFFTLNRSPCTLKNALNIVYDPHSHSVSHRNICFWCCCCCLFRFGYARTWPQETIR